MNAEEQLEWCRKNKATVWWGKGGVKLKVSGIETKAAPTLAEAITKTEEMRQINRNLKAIADAQEEKERGK